MVRAIALIFVCCFAWFLMVRHRGEASELVLRASPPGLVQAGTAGT